MPWIKVRTNLTTDPRVWEIARRVGCSVPCAVGGLVAVWSFADEHSTDGVLRFVDTMRLDTIAGASGFAAAMAAVDWLRTDEAGQIVLPRFGEHNGETAKQRAQGAVRVARHRVATGNADSVSPCNADSVTGCNVDSVTREEERRGEKRRKTSARATARGKGI